MSLIGRGVVTLFALILLSVVGHAQVTGINDSSTQKAEERGEFHRELLRATEEYEASLKTLVESYQVSLDKLAVRNAKFQELYREGIILRREMESSDAALTEARLKVEVARHQLDQAAETLTVATKLPPTEESEDMTGEAAGQVERPWTTSNRSIDNLIKYYGSKYNVDPYLIFCVMHQESRFGPGVTSGKSAMGLMQLMPGTAARYGVTNPYDPAQSIMGGARYLKDLLTLFGGRIDLVLADYNAGEGAVRKYGNRIPPYGETKAYVRTISYRYRQVFHALKPASKTKSARPLNKVE
jgi:soluble lytic murein transglycosylase-like protein